MGDVGVRALLAFMSWGGVVGVLSGAGRAKVAAGTLSGSPLVVEFGRGRAPEQLEGGGSLQQRRPAKGGERGNAARPSGFLTVRWSELCVGWLLFGDFVVENGGCETEGGSKEQRHGQKTC